jgi:hypothetical protein
MRITDSGGRDTGPALRGHNSAARVATRAADCGDCGPAGTAGGHDARNPVMRISHPHANLMLERSQAGLAIELGRSAHGAAILPVERGVLSLLYHILPACRLCGILW